MVLIVVETVFIQSDMHAIWLTYTKRRTDVKANQKGTSRPFGLRELIIYTGNVNTILIRRRDMEPLEAERYVPDLWAS